jgi:hypothetical protein
MTDYIKQVAEAVQYECAIDAFETATKQGITGSRRNEYKIKIQRLDLYEAIAGVPKPEPVGTVDDCGYIKWNSPPWLLSPGTLIYTQVPDTQSAILALERKATELEGFIDRLLEDMRVAREQLARYKVIINEIGE